MATHKLIPYWEVLFDDGTTHQIEFPSNAVYYFQEQKNQYLIIWLEAMIENLEIKSKPISIAQKYRVIECEPYNIVIGV